MNLIPNSGVPIKVIFEDDDIIVVDKQAGVPVYPLKDDEMDTLANGLVAQWPGADFVHRLDNDTSGLILAAKNGDVLKKIREQFEAHTILKHYTALVLGEPPPQETIKTPVVHDPKNAKRMRVVTKGSRLETSDKAQEAVTNFKVIKKYAAGAYSLLEVRIKTGVRHQIRVHLASIGHPLTGDPLYQNSRSRKIDRLGLKRQFLHASKLGFNHPRTEEWVEFGSELPRDLQNALTKIAKS